MRTKTAADIVNDVIDEVVECSPLHAVINGQILKDGTRDLNSPSEDTVVGFIAGLDGQFQDGVVVINTFIPDIDNGSGSMVKNTARCEEIESASQEMVDKIRPSSEYLFKLDAMIMTYKVHEASQHFVNVRLKFTRKNFRK